MNEIAARSSLSMYSMFMDADLFMKVLILAFAKGRVNTEVLFCGWFITKSMA